MLGELYRPSGLAFETAKAVLEVEDPYAVNVALGCSNGCKYCYVPKFMRRSSKACLNVRLPRKSTVELVNDQLYRKPSFKVPDGVFLSFLTDPFLPEVARDTEKLIEMLVGCGIRVATLSKLSWSGIHGVRQGMTIVSLDDAFWKEYEPNTTHPIHRLIALKTCKREFQDFVWVSMEPYPPSSILKQDFEALLQELKFVDLMVFGKWNYDSRARTEEARIEYAQNIDTLVSFCRKNKIRLHIKSDTWKWAYESRHEQDPCEFLGAES